MKRAVISAAVAAAVLAVAGAGVWWCWYLPNQNLMNLDWLESASRQELRETSERVVRWPWGNHHDACLYLEVVGDAGSIQVIERALDWVDDSGPGRVASCTLSHCREAMEVLRRKAR